jgi:hypothetical protein
MIFARTIFVSEYFDATKKEIVSSLGLNVIIPMKLKILIKLLFVVPIIALFISCEKVDDTPVIYGDAIVRSFIRGDSIVYGLCFYTYSYDRMKQVKVTKEGVSAEQLLDSTENRYTFYYLPDSSSYTTQKPASGKYLFDAVFDDGTELTSYDYLDTAMMKPPVVKKYLFDSVDIKFNLEWNKVTYAQQYRILLENDSNEVVFQSDFLSSSQLSLGITTSTNGWLTSKIPDGGEKYKAIIVAYQYEAIATAFDLQSISFAEGNYFKWKIYND